MILPNNNISIMDVRNLTGYPSTSQGTLIAVAKIGGKGKFAFNIAENGAAVTDGTLVAGARPYWNIYSPKSPGEWRLPDDPNGEAFFRLKRDDTGRYCFKLSGFCGYNSAAKEPEAYSGLMSVQQNTGIGNEHTFVYNPYIYLGGMDWRIQDVAGRYTADKVALVITDAYGKRQVSNKIPLTGQSSVTFEGYRLSVLTHIVTTYEYTTSIELYAANDVKLGVLPVYGKLQIVVTALPKSAEMWVNVDGMLQIYTLKRDLYLSGSNVKGDFEYQRLFDDNPRQRRLQKIVYQAVYLSDLSVASTLTVTTFNNFEWPIILYDNVNKTEVTFSCDKSRISVTASQYVKAILYYE